MRALAPGARLAPGELRLVGLRRGEELLDRALAVVLAPDEVELHLHGSPALVAEVLAALGGETPQPESGTLEDEALRALPEAASETGARILLDQAEGALRREIEELASLTGAALDARLAELLERARVARFVLRPTRVLLRGPVNAGKSTLFNAIVAAERVLVADEPGTTRDIVREVARLGGYPVELWDTPGERTADAPASRGLELERAGLDLARELERAADWIVWLVPPGARAPDSAELGAPVAVFTSRADEVRGAAPNPLATRVDPAGAVRAVAARLCEHFALPESAWRAGLAVPFGERQVEVLRAARRAPAAERHGLIASLLKTAAAAR
ncbi:MAG TPA: GTPase [Planctomycetota bacterium]|nr:GTPase [Planctomycetota bacterium]